MASRQFLTRFAWLSIAAAVFTIALKLAAYTLTGSVGLLSDALESFVNLAGGIMALAMLTIAGRPADDSHDYGHGKAEYFSSGVEGTLILLAAAGIILSAVERLIHPRPLEQIELGLGVSLAASLVNLVVALVIRRYGKQYGSITLQANARHLLTDVWTSGGVLLAVGAVAVTGWQTLDPIIAIVVAANIIRSGGSIVKQSIMGLMDAALPADEQKLIRETIKSHLPEGVHYHALRTRQAGARHFASFHVLVPGSWTVERGHLLMERLEIELSRAVPNLVVFTHMEPLNDPASWQDLELDRDEQFDDTQLSLHDKENFQP